MTSWELFGSARRKGDAISIVIDAPITPTEFVVAAQDVEYLFDGTCVPVHGISATGPYQCGVAHLSRSGKTIRLSIPGAGIYGALQIIAAHIRAHYQRNDRRAVDVILPPQNVTGRGSTA